MTLNDDHSTLYDFLTDADWNHRHGNLETANMNWRSAEQRAKTDKDEAKHLYVDGSYTALFFAVFSQAPYYVVEAILKAYPEACKITSLPLRVACEIGSKESPMDKNVKPYSAETENIIRLLMKSYPEAIDRDVDSLKSTIKTTALHLILEHQPTLSLVKGMVGINEKLRGSATSSTSKRTAKRVKQNSLLETADKQGQMPLHVALEYNASEDIIKYLISLKPSAAKHARNHDGYLPLHIATKSECIGNVLNVLIEAFPAALTKKTKQLNQTPLHLMFNFEFDNFSYDWDMENEKSNIINSDVLSGKATCELLLDAHVDRMVSDEQKSKTIKKLFGLKDSDGRTILESAVNCGKIFPVPDSLIQLFERAERGQYISEPISQEETNCVYCFENKKEMGFLPCKHMCVCKACWDEHKEKGFKNYGCPMCRQPIESATAWFL